MKRVAVGGGKGSWLHHCRQAAAQHTAGECAARPRTRGRQQLRGRMPCCQGTQHGAWLWHRRGWFVKLLQRREAGAPAGTAAAAPAAPAAASPYKRRGCRRLLGVLRRTGSRRAKAGWAGRSAAARTGAGFLAEAPHGDRKPITRLDQPQEVRFALRLGRCWGFLLALPPPCRHSTCGRRRLPSQRVLAEPLIKSSRIYYSCNAALAWRGGRGYRAHGPEREAAAAPALLSLVALHHRTIGPVWQLRCFGQAMCQRALRGAPSGIAVHSDMLPLPWPRMLNGGLGWRLA